MLNPREIKIRDEFITLGQLLKVVDCIQSGGEAKHYLQVTHITINGEKENRRGRKIYPGDLVMVNDCGTFSIVHK